MRTRPASSRRAAESAWSARRIISCASSDSVSVRDREPGAELQAQDAPVVPLLVEAADQVLGDGAADVAPGVEQDDGEGRAAVPGHVVAAAEAGPSAVAISPRTRSPERRSRRSLTQPKLSGPRRMSTAGSLRSTDSARATSSSAWNSGRCGRPVTWSKSVRETVRAWAAKAAARPRKFFHQRSSLRVSDAVGNCSRPSCRRAAVAGRSAGRSTPRARPATAHRACAARGGASSLASTQPGGCDRGRRRRRCWAAASRLRPPRRCVSPEAPVQLGRRGLVGQLGKGLEAAFVEEDLALAARPRGDVQRDRRRPAQALHQPHIGPEDVGRFAHRRPSSRPRATGGAGRGRGDGALRPRGGQGVGGAGSIGRRRRISETSTSGMQGLVRYPGATRLLGPAPGLGVRVPRERDDGNPARRGRRP